MNKTDYASMISVSHDAFARTEVVREKVSGTCAWCGGKARFRYGTRSDGLTTRPSLNPRAFCNITCYRSFAV